MREWWQWSPLQESERLSFAIIGVGRFGIAVCRELLNSGAEVLAVDRSERAIDELRQLEPSIEARVVDCTEEEALREAEEAAAMEEMKLFEDRHDEEGRTFPVTADCSFFLMQKNNLSNCSKSDQQRCFIFTRKKSELKYCRFYAGPEEGEDANEESEEEEESGEE